MVDFEDSFHITLMGLAVTNFLDEVEKKGSIKTFFISPKKDGVPQSVPTASIKRKDSQQISQKVKDVNMTF